MAINAPDPSRNLWQLYPTEWDMKFNCARYYADYILEAGFYGALATSGRYGRFTEYSSGNTWWGFVDTKGTYPYPIIKPNYYLIPYHPKNSWQGRRLGTIQIWSVSLEWSEENYLIVFVNEDGGVDWGIRVRDAELFPYFPPWIKS